MTTEVAAGIATELLALAAHYPAKRLAPDVRARWLADYVDDLTGAGFELLDVRIACANWRTSEASRMPTPGELLAYCRKVFRPDRYVPLPAPPPAPAMDPEERARVGEMMRELAAELAGKLKAKAQPMRQGRRG
jgi:hypothetical protein